MMARLLSLLIVVVLCGCSSLPQAADASDAASVEGPPAVLALATPPAETEPPIAVAASDEQRFSNRLASTPEDGATQLEPLEVPGLSSASPIVETRIAVMPETLGSIDVFDAASQFGEVKITFQRLDEFNQPRVFRIVGEQGDYFHVQVPMRPNGSTGYIRKSDVEVTSTDQRIQIDLSERSVVVWDGDEIVLDTTGTVGQARTPTPTGSFYVRNVFEWYAESIYGPYVIPLSAYSEAIDQINGGDAVVAIHGTQRPDLVGAAASLGCIRLDNDTLRQLAAIVEPGAPVDVVE